MLFENIVHPDVLFASPFPIKHPEGVQIECSGALIGKSIQVGAQNRGNGVL